MFLGHRSCIGRPGLHKLLKTVNIMDNCADYGMNFPSYSMVTGETSHPRYSLSRWICLNIFLVYMYVC